MTRDKYPIKNEIIFAFFFRLFLSATKTAVAVTAMQSRRQHVNANFEDVYIVPHSTRARVYFFSSLLQIFCLTLFWFSFQLLFFSMDFCLCAVRSTLCFTRGKRSHSTDDLRVDWLCCGYICHIRRCVCVCALKSVLSIQSEYNVCETIMCSCDEARAGRNRMRWLCCFGSVERLRIWCVRTQPMMMPLSKT